MLFLEEVFLEEVNELLEGVNRYYNLFMGFGVLEKEECLFVRRREKQPGVSGSDRYLRYMFTEKGEGF